MHVEWARYEINGERNYRLVDNKQVIATIDFKHIIKQYRIFVRVVEWRNYFTSKEIKEIKTLINNMINNDTRWKYFIKDLKRVFYIY